MSPREPTDVGSDHAQIAMATFRLVGELGADRVTVADVAKDLGISGAAIARQCPTEGNLWRITAAFIAQQISQSWTTSLCNELPPTERLRCLLALQIDLITKTPALRDILFSRRLHQNYSALTRELSRVRRQFQQLLASAVADGIAAGDFQSGLCPDETARRIIEMLQAFVLSWSLAFEPDFSLEHVWKRLDAILDRPSGDDDAAATTGNGSAVFSGEDE